MIKGFLVAMGLLLAAGGCAKRLALVDAAPHQVQGYHYVGAYVETADPGRLDAGKLKHYFDTTGIRRRIQEQAAAAGATHLVWLYDYGTSAAALGYRNPTPGERPAEEGWELHWAPTSMTLFSMLLYLP